MLRQWLALSILLLQLAWAQNNPVVVEIEVFVVEDDGTFRSSTTAEAGDIIEYRVTATNVDPTTLPANSVSIVGPVPDIATYVPDSATQSEELILEYSSDSTEFSQAALGEIRALHWTYQKPFEPDGTLNMTYRVTIKGASPSATSDDPLSDSSGAHQVYTQAMFGHLGVVEVSCSSEMRAQIAESQTVTCGEVSSDFDLFRQAWDLYADYEDEVPIIPTATTAWRLNNGSYSRNYDLSGSAYSVIFTQVAEREGFVVVVYSP